jgi:hypothetical protein
MLELACLLLVGAATLPALMDSPSRVVLAVGSILLLSPVMAWLVVEAMHRTPSHGSYATGMANAILAVFSVAAAVTVLIVGAVWRVLVLRRRSREARSPARRAGR